MTDTPTLTERIEQIDIQTLFTKKLASELSRYDTAIATGTLEGIPKGWWLYLKDIQSRMLQQAATLGYWDIRDTWDYQNKFGIWCHEDKKYDETALLVFLRAGLGALPRTYTYTGKMIEVSTCDNTIYVRLNPEL